MVKKAKITVYCCGLFLDSILSKRAGFSICRSNFSQGPYSNIIHTLGGDDFAVRPCKSNMFSTLKMHNKIFILAHSNHLWPLFLKPTNSQEQEQHLNY